MWSLSSPDRRRNKQRDSLAVTSRITDGFILGVRRTFLARDESLEQHEGRAANTADNKHHLAELTLG